KGAVAGRRRRGRGGDAALAGRGHTAIAGRAPAPEVGFRRAAGRVGRDVPPAPRRSRDRGRTDGTGGHGSLAAAPDARGRAGRRPPVAGRTPGPSFGRAGPRMAPAESAALTTILRACCPEEDVAALGSDH